MIVPMKHLTLLCVASEGEKALESLRDLRRGARGAHT